MNGSLGEVAGDAPVTVLDVLPTARPLPDAVRASLEAVRAAQLAGRARARREMWQARAWVGGVAAVVTIAGLVAWPHLHGGKVARAASAANHPVKASVATETAPAAPVLAPGGLLAAGVAELPAVHQPSAVAADAASFDACRDSYQGKRWRTAAAACATAFAARPDDAKLALKVAEAEYARDHLPEAREWAQRTLALDAKQADALAIVGRSEQRTGHSEAAAVAFRRYLALAPRGWHATEARAALRRDHATARPTVTPARHEDAAPLPSPAAESGTTAPAAFAPPPPAPNAP